MLASAGLFLALWSSGHPTHNRVIGWERVVVRGEPGEESISEPGLFGEPRREGFVSHYVVWEDGAKGQQGCTARFGYGHFAVTRRKDLVESVSKYSIPALAQDELCPLFGAIWRAEEDCDKGRFPLKLVPDDELPAGVKSPDRYAIVLPHSRGFSEGSSFRGIPDEPPGLTREQRWFRMVECELHLMKVDKVVKYEKVSYTATIKYQERKEVLEAKVSEGDILVVGKPVNAGLLVKSITPPDKKTKVIGWVELSGTAIPLDDVEKVAKDEKRAVVKFEKDEDKK